VDQMRRRQLAVVPMSSSEGRDVAGLADMGGEHRCAPSLLGDLLRQPFLRTF
jgi:hypothetical protein